MKCLDVRLWPKREMKSLNQSKVLNIVETLVVEVAKNLGPNFTLKEKNVRTIIDIKKMF